MRRGSRRLELGEAFPDPVLAVLEVASVLGMDAAKVGVADAAADAVVEPAAVGIELLGPGCGHGGASSPRPPRGKFPGPCLFAFCEGITLRHGTANSRVRAGSCSSRAGEVLVARSLPAEEGKKWVSKIFLRVEYITATGVASFQGEAFYDTSQNDRNPYFTGSVTNGLTQVAGEPGENGVHVFLEVMRDGLGWSSPIFKQLVKENVQHELGHTLIGKTDHTRNPVMIDRGDSDNWRDNYTLETLDKIRDLSYIRSNY
jgi:hypothetical protein